MINTTVGQLLVNHALPPDLRDYSRVLDGKTVKALFQKVAEKYPDQYRDVAKKLSDLGRHMATTTGGFSFGAEHLKQSEAHAKVRQQIEQEIQRIVDSDMSDEDKSKAVIVAVGQHQKPLQEAVYQEALAKKNPLATQILSGSRGKPANLNSLIGSDLLYRDHRDRTIPIPILRSYSQGLTPAEYFAGAFGARQGVISTKFATADAGFFGKQLTQSGHRLLITKLDADDDRQHGRGMPVSVDDADNEGALLSFPVGGYARNTELTPKILRDLKAQGIERIVVRSPIVGGPPEGGLYARDVGVRERGGLSPIGDQVGIAAAAAISEPISQGGLSEKHSGGVAGAGRTVGGFKLLDMLVQSPKTFTGGAAHATTDGVVQSIADAPAGGKTVRIEGKDHYVPPGVDIHVKPGDEVEAGDVLSAGTPQPARIVEHKGIGEGRRYFIKAFGDAMRLNNLHANRRNLEILARGLINHVRLTEESGEYSPDDVVSYDQLEHDWVPRPGHRTAAAGSALGKYLEKPVLHYSIGTKVTKSMLPTLKEFGINDLTVHDEPPPFKPEMVRGLENLQHDPDWLTQQLGSNLKKSFLRSVHRGATSDSAGTSYVPALANPVHFGRRGLVRGFVDERVQPVFSPPTAGSGFLSSVLAEPGRVPPPVQGLSLGGRKEEVPTQQGQGSSETPGVSPEKSRSLLDGL